LHMEKGGGVKKMGGRRKNKGESVKCRKTASGRFGSQRRGNRIKFGRLTPERKGGGVTTKETPGKKSQRQF